MTPGFDAEALQERLEEIAEGYEGVYGVVVLEPVSGTKVSLLGDEEFMAASIGKLPPFVALYRAAARGELDLEEEISILPEDVQDYGFGGLNYFPTGHSLSLSECAYHLVNHSDNTACAPPATPGLPSLGGSAAGNLSVGAAAKAGKAATAAKTDKNGNDPAVSIRFHLKVDQLAIGWWNSFEGLGMETAVMQLEEGGNNAFVHQLPTRLKYSNIKLSRPINEDSHKVATWFMDIAKVVKRGHNASIKAVDGLNKTIAEWHLVDVVPVRWTGPTFNVESPKMAMETLEMAFHGFLSGAAKGA